MALCDDAAHENVFIENLGCGANEPTCGSIRIRARKRHLKEVELLPEEITNSDRQEGSAWKTPVASDWKAGLPADMIDTVRRFPTWLRFGAWSPLCYVYLCSFMFALCWSLPDVLEQSPPAALQKGDAVLFWFRVIGGSWGLYMIYYQLTEGSLWGFVSYTMQTWTMLTIYLVTSALASVDEGPVGASATIVASLLRFPALVQSTVTVAIWWCVMIPVVLTVSSDRLGFIKFNFGFMMFNYHFLIGPASALDFYLSGAPLSPFDLWAGCAAGFAYILFYLSFLDPRDLPIYIFLSPRLHVCPLIYSAITALYVCVYAVYNASVSTPAPVLGIDAAQLARTVLWPGGV